MMTHLTMCHRPLWWIDHAIIQSHKGEFNDEHIPIQLNAIKNRWGWVRHHARSDTAPWIIEASHSYPILPNPSRCCDLSDQIFERHSTGCHPSRNDLYRKPYCVILWDNLLPIICGRFPPKNQQTNLHRLPLMARYRETFASCLNNVFLCAMWNNVLYWS